MLRPRGGTGYGQRAPKETWKDRTQGPLGTDSFGAKRRKITYRSDASSDSAGAQRPRSTRIRKPMKAPRAPALRKPSRAPNMNATFQPVEKLSALKLDHNRPPPMPHAADDEYPTCEEVSAWEKVSAWKMRTESAHHEEEPQFPTNISNPKAVPFTPQHSSSGSNPKAVPFTPPNAPRTPPQIAEPARDAERAMPEQKATRSMSATRVADTMVRTCTDDGEAERHEDSPSEMERCEVLFQTSRLLSHLDARQTPPQSTEAAARAAGISLGEAQTAQRAHYAVTMAELSQAMDRPGAVAALTNAGPEAYRYWKHLAQEVGRTAEVPPAKACSADSSAPSDQNVSVEPKEETNDGPEETEKTADSESTAQASGNQRTADRDERNETGKEKRGLNRTAQRGISPRNLKIRAALHQKRNPWILAMQLQLRKASTALDPKPGLVTLSLPLGSRIQYTIWGTRKTARGHLPHVLFPTACNAQGKAPVEAREQLEHKAGLPLQWYSIYPAAAAAATAASAAAAAAAAAADAFADVL